ncbi:protein of unknown function [Pararobbsia alpina]
MFLHWMSHSVTKSLTACAPKALGERPTTRLKALLNALSEGYPSERQRADAVPLPKREDLANARRLRCITGTHGAPVDP